MDLHDRRHAKQSPIMYNSSTPQISVVLVLTVWTRSRQTKAWRPTLSVDIQQVQTESLYWTDCWYPGLTGPWLTGRTASDPSASRQNPTSARQSFPTWSSSILLRPVENRISRLDCWNTKLISFERKPRGKSSQCVQSASLYQQSLVGETVFYPAQFYPRISSLQAVKCPFTTG